MKQLNLLKLIVRNWWRNKLFFLVAVVSLSVGLACTNLLLTYFMHDYHIEYGNPNKDDVYCLRQDNPMEQGEKVAYAAKDIPQQIKDKISGVDGFMRVQSFEASTVQYQSTELKNLIVLGVDSAINSFFPMVIAAGDISRTLAEPDKVALSQRVANRLFGKQNPLGKIIDFGLGKQKRSLEVTAVFKERTQSLLKYDMLTSLTADYWGGVAFLKLIKGSSVQQIVKAINADQSIPTLMPGQLKYYVDPLSDLYFVDKKGTQQQPLSFIQQTQVQLLYVGLLAALLILIIACCNYTNMSLSRLMQQLKMIYVEKLMGGGMKEIRFQLFGDVVLTVAISFLFSLLIISDCLPTFNAVLGSRLEMSYFFSGQMLPLLLGFLLLMAVVPAWYMSHRLMHLSYSEYKTSYTGRRKQFFVALLVIVQFAISCGLILSTLMAYKQQQMVTENASCYKDCIEIGDPFAPPASSLKAELEKRVKGIESISLSQGQILQSPIRELQVKQPDGTEKRTFLLMLYGDEQYLHTMGIEQIAGKPLKEICQEQAYPVLVNESYVRNLVPRETNPIGHPLREFDSLADSLYVIEGVVRDFPINSLEKEITPTVIYFPAAEQMKKANVLDIRLKKENRAETMTQIEKIWKEMNHEGTFSYTDLHRDFMKRNNKVISFTQVLTVYAVIGLLLTLFGLFAISWYATRQRIREISIRKIHGASRWQIVWLLNKPFTIYAVLSYLLALPFTYYWLNNWFGQFAYHVSFSMIDFVLPFLIIWLVSVAAICVQAYFLLQIDPVKALKSE